MRFCFGHEGVRPRIPKYSCAFLGVSYFLSLDYMDFGKNYLFSESRKEAHEKKWSWLSQLLNKENKDVLYNTRVITQEFDPQPN